MRRDIWQLSKAAFKVQQVDVHTRLMKRYKQVPQWWFLGILFITILVAIAACQTYSEQLQLPWWGVVLACVIAFFFTLPVGVIRATTNQVIQLSIFTNFRVGILYQGRECTKSSISIFS